MLISMVVATMVQAAPATRPAVPATPRVPLHMLISHDDYPAFARRYELQGQTAVVLAIDANGRVDGCTVVASSGHASLDSATCGLLGRRARFTPARDARGRFVRDSFRTAMRWTLGSKLVVPAPTT